MHRITGPLCEETTRFSSQWAVDVELWCFRIVGLKEIISRVTGDLRRHGARVTCVIGTPKDKSHAFISEKYWTCTEGFNTLCTEFVWRQINMCWKSLFSLRLRCGWIFGAKPEDSSILYNWYDGHWRPGDARGPASTSYGIKLVPRNIPVSAPQGLN